MSLKIRSQVEELTGLGKSKSVLSQLANSSSECGFCFPSISTIAHRSGVSVRSVHRHLKTLEGVGYVKRESRFRSNGSKTTNGYYLNLPRIEREFKHTEVPVDNTSENPFLNDKNTGEANNDGMCHSDSTICQSVTTRMCHSDITNNDQYNDHNNNTPQEGEAVEQVKLPDTRNPHHKKYTPTIEEQKKIVDHWNKFATGKFSLKRIFNSECATHLTQSYATYLDNHKHGYHEDAPLKTKVQFALDLTESFVAWVDNNHDSAFYLKHAANKKNAWSADLDYALKKTTYEKLLNAKTH